MSLRIILCLLWLTVCSTLLFLLSCQKAGPVDIIPSSSAGPILFISDKSGTNQLYSMEENGSDIMQLSKDTSFPVEYATWSPDGQKIALTSRTGGVNNYGPAIYIMNADGSSRYKLTQATPQNFNYAAGDKPTWSPDSRKIAFHRVMIPESMGNTDIFVIGVDGKNEEQITNTPNIPENICSWSNDGNYLFFGYTDYTIRDSLGRIGNNSSQIARMTIHGDSIWTLTTSSNGGSGAKISPNDSLIALSSFVSFDPRIGQAFQMQIMNANGTNRHALKQNDARYEYAVAWSVDSKRILYSTEDDGTVPYQNPPRQIIIINSDGSGMRNISPFDPRYAVFFATSWKRR